MKKMSAEQVQSAWFFFTFRERIVKTLPSYLMERLKEMKKQLQQNPLQKSGDTLE
jgi:hypothetical protein